jgi:uncharacterized protein
MITNILYLHGLNKKLSPEKVEALQEFGNVFAPQVDYYNDRFFPEIMDIVMNETIHVVIGTGLGGYLAYSIGLLFDMPCLLFNPDFVNHNISEDIKPPLENKKKSLSYIVLGKDDIEIPFVQNLDKIIGIDYDNCIYISIQQEMEHLVPFENFVIESARFFVMNRMVNEVDNLSVHPIGGDKKSITFLS